MRIGAFFFGGVEMPDAGAGPPAPTDRRYGAAVFARTQERLLDLGVAADRLGYDAFWLTEHHFQYEGYEVVPNAILFGAFLAERTRRIRIGALFNIVPQWHPLRLAEDFAMLHNLSGGRAILGVGRGTVPREAEPLGTVIGSYDNPDKADADRINREVMDEAMAVIRLALDNERFSFHGRHFNLPPRGIPDRGGTVQELTLVPRPLWPYEIWQAITSPPTLEQVPRAGYGGVFWLLNHGIMRAWWDHYADNYAAARAGEADGAGGDGGAAAGAGPVGGTELPPVCQPGERRMLVLNIRIADTHEAAWASARPGHDEFWKFLGPYGWSRGYLGPDGRPSAPGLIPTLEESVTQRVWVIGDADEVAEGIDYYREQLSVQDLAIFPGYPGDSFEVCEEQLVRFAEEVAPRLGCALSAPAPGAGA